MDKGQLTLDRLLDHLSLANSAEGKSPATIRWYKESVGEFIRYLSSGNHSLRLADVGLQEAREFVASLRERTQKFAGTPFTPTREQPLSSYTTQGRVRALRAFFNSLYREGYTREHRLQALKVPKVQQKVIQTLTQDET